MQVLINGKNCKKFKKIYNLVLSTSTKFHFSILHFLVKGLVIP